MSSRCWQTSFSASVETQGKSARVNRKHLSGVPSTGSKESSACRLRIARRAMLEDSRLRGNDGWSSHPCEDWGPCSETGL